MPVAPETPGNTDWSPRKDAPRRSIFPNYKPEAPRVVELEAGSLVEESPPLTPAPSPGASEHRSTNAGPNDSVRRQFPLPAGEGPGEGEGNAHPLQSAIDQSIARSFVYRFVAKCFEDPAFAGWSNLTDPRVQADFRAAIEVLSANHPDYPNAAEKLLSWLTSGGSDAFTDSYLVTFGHAARGPCPMNEIEYGNLKADSLFQPHRLADLNAFYRAFGLELAEDATERPDHICLELEFMSVLAAKEAYALEHQLDADPLAVVQDAQKKFLREHLGHWLPAFTRRLEREAGDGALAALALFTRVFVLGECARCNVPPGSEELLLRPVDEAAERMCESCGLANNLPGALAPAT